MAAAGDPEIAPPRATAPRMAEDGGGESWISYVAHKATEFTESYGSSPMALYDRSLEDVRHVARQALALPETLGDSAGAAAEATRSRLSAAFAAYSARIRDKQASLERFKAQYAVYEDMVVGKIKEGVVVAALHPSLSCGIAAGVGLVVFRRPRQMIIHNIRRLFVSEESLLSDAEAKVNELRQSINLVKNESIKLEERASKAQAEMEQGRMKLINEGRKIQKELRYINRIEKEAKGLKELISELPGREVSRYRSEVSNLISQVKENKEDLSETISRIINRGIRI